MKKPADFRPSVPTLEYPRVAAFQGRDAFDHAKAGLSHPIFSEMLYKPCEAAYAQSFRGITTDGHVMHGLFSLGQHGAPVVAMRQAVGYLWEQLSSDERQALSYAVDAREWRRWNNTEYYVYQQGLRLELVSPAVRQLILDVLKASLSEIGYQKTRDVMRLNHFLGELTNNTKVLGEWSFNFTLFGSPSDTEPWGWQVMGHHLALNCFVGGGQMILSPAFMGAEPTYADVGPWAGTRLFEAEESGGLEVMRSLTPFQRDQAVLFASNLAKDLPEGRRHRADQLHLGGAFHDNRIIPLEGLCCNQLSLEQKKKLLDLVKVFVEPLPEGPQKARLEEVEKHIDATYFCWIGGFGEDDTFYYRIQSPVVMIEFDHHSGVYLANELPAKFHIHTIVRTPNGNDYGIDLLRQHYAQSHHQESKPGDHGGHVGHTYPHSHLDSHSHNFSHTHDGHTHHHLHDHSNDHLPNKDKK